MKVKLSLKVKPRSRISQQETRLSDSLESRSTRLVPQLQREIEDASTLADGIRPMLNMESRKDSKTRNPRNATRRLQEGNDKAIG